MDLKLVYFVGSFFLVAYSVGWIISLFEGNASDESSTDTQITLSVYWGAKAAILFAIGYPLITMIFPLYQRESNAPKETAHWVAKTAKVLHSDASDGFESTANCAHIQIEYSYLKQIIKTDLELPTQCFDGGDVVAKLKEGS